MTKDSSANRAKNFYSAKKAKGYPVSVPRDERYQIYIDNIEAGCKRENGKTNVLELGCGTGRYFDFITNVEKLVGVDISDDMLKIASEKIKSMPELAAVTELIQSDIDNYSTNEKFDFIYSIGTLGEYCGFTLPTFEKMLLLLKPSGFLFFTLVDAGSFVNDEYIWLTKRVKRFFVKWLPAKWRMNLEADTLIMADWKHFF